MSTSRHRDASEKVTIASILTNPLVGPIIAIVFVLLAGFGLVFPILPLFARSFGVGNDGAGLLIGGFGFARLFGDLIGGSIVDRKGERWTAVAGMSFLALCSIATGAAPNFPAAVVFWGLAGVGSAIVFASLFSYILKAAPSDRVARTLSFFYGAFNAGVIAGGAAGGFIAGEFGLEAPLFAYSAILMVGIVVYLRFVPRLPASRPEAPAGEAAIADAATAEAPRPSGRIVRDLLRVPGFKTTLFLNLTYLWFVAAIFNTLVPLFAHDELGMSTGAIGAMFAVGVAAEFLVLFPAGALADRHGRKAVMLPSLAGLVVMILLLGTSSSAVMLTLLLAVLAVCSGFAGVPPAAMLSDIVPAEQSGRGVGAFRFAGDIGFFLGPLIAGAASERFGFQTAFTVTAVVPAVAVALTIRLRETLRRGPATGEVMRRAEPISTARLTLEPLRADHAAEMLEVLGDPRLHEVTGGRLPSADELRERYERLESGRSPDGREQWLNWIVRRRSDGRAVGTVQATIRSTSTNTSADIAWVVGVPWQRRGFASEAAIAVVGWLEVNGVSVVSAYIRPGHLASERVAELAGLTVTPETADGERLWRKIGQPE